MSQPRGPQQPGAQPVDRSPGAGRFVNTGGASGQHVVLCQGSLVSGDRIAWLIKV